MLSGTKSRCSEKPSRAHEFRFQTNRKIFSVMQGIAAGDGLVRVGAIADVLRDENAQAAWEEADFSKFSNAGRITLDTASGLDGRVRAKVEGVA